MLFYNFLNTNFNNFNFKFNLYDFNRCFSNISYPIFTNQFNNINYNPPIGDYFTQTCTKTFNYPTVPPVQTYAYSYLPSNYLSSKITTNDQKIPYVANPSLVNYRSLSRSEALNAAQKDSNLELLYTSVSEKGHTVKISDRDFKNDIPYAKKGAMDILLSAADKIGKDLTVTSALGCKTSPHSGTSTGNTHYNPINPKIDIGGGLSHEQAEILANELRGTGLFEQIIVEKDGATSHLDIKIAMSSYDKFA